MDRRLKQAIDDIRAGKMIILLDNESREDEGDLVIAAQFVTSEVVNFFRKYTTGYLCAPMKTSTAERLNLPLLQDLCPSTDPLGTPFTISCDSVETTTGVSSHDRALTVTRLADPKSNKKDFHRPGHICPLVSKRAGLFDRAGHTEGSVELCQLAGIRPVAFIGELIKDDGTMMRVSDCQKFAEEHNLNIVTIDLIIDHISKTKQIRPTASCDLELNKYGKWELICYNSGDSFSPHRVLIKGKLNTSEDPVLLRVHSECFTGDLLESCHCDCGEQLRRSLEMITQAGRGIIVLPAKHEGRGIGLTEKVKAYRLIQTKGVNTYDANVLLGHKEDARDYSCVLKILDDLDVGKVNLLTANHDKIITLKERISKVIPLDCEPNEINSSYLAVKADRSVTTETQNKLNTASSSMVLPELPKDLKVAIISTHWNSELLANLVSDLENRFKTVGNVQVYTVPGSFEIPLQVKRLLNQDFDVIVCLGVIIKGETAHFEYISGAVINGLMTLQLSTNVPIINGVLNVYTLEQAKERLNSESGFAESLYRSSLVVLGSDSN